MSHRLAWLLCILSVIAGLRLWDSESTVNFVDAVPLSSRVVRSIPGRIPAAAPVAASTSQAFGEISRMKPNLDDPQRDPFAVASRDTAIDEQRAPQVLAMTPPSAAGAMVASAVSAAPVFPLSVLGRWVDGERTLIFLGGAGRTEQVAVGDKVAGQFVVTHIDAAFLELRHEPTGQVIRRPIGVAGSGGS